MFSPGPSFNSEKTESWIQRVVENLRLALHAVKVYPSAATGAPLHFESVDMSAKRGAPQTLSAGVHLAILVALAFLAVSGPRHISDLHGIQVGPAKPLTEYIPQLNPQDIGQASLGTNGGGGENDPRPTRFGQFAPGSSMPLVPPRLNRNQENVLPVPPAVFDPNAPANVPTVTLGLPWMNGDTDSAGPGKGHGFGSGEGDTMGDGHGGNGAGDGEGNGSYANVASPVTCLYCPEPGYTEEARKAKLQGKVLLQVLVGPDGTAKRVKIIQGLGMGLDERAEEAVLAWRFSPGRDAAKRAVATWVTIETRFQLF
jgi:periplasmic protein TonB